MISRIRKGQSTLEYVIILAVVIGAIIGAAAVFKADLAKAYNELYNTSGGSNTAGPGPSGGGGGTVVMAQ